MKKALYVGDNVIQGEINHYEIGGVIHNDHSMVIQIFIEDYFDVTTLKSELPEYILSMRVKNGALEFLSDGRYYDAQTGFSFFCDVCEELAHVGIKPGKRSMGKKPKADFAWLRFIATLFTMVFVGLFMSYLVFDVQLGQFLKGRDTISINTSSYVIASIIPLVILGGILYSGKRFHIFNPYSPRSRSKYMLSATLVSFLIVAGLFTFSILYQGNIFFNPHGDSGILGLTESLNLLNDAGYSEVILMNFCAVFIFSALSYIPIFIMALQNIKKDNKDYKKDRNQERRDYESNCV